MTNKQLGFRSTPSLAIAEGATAPNPGSPGVGCWSTTLGKPVSWTGLMWTAGVSEIPAGAVMSYASSTAPPGWLKANGAPISRATYAALFAAIGTTFGVGDGSTTFAVPDIRGEFLRGWDDGRGIDSGRALGSAQAEDFKSHTHSQHYLPGGAGAYLASYLDYYFDPASGVTGATGGTETRPRNIALLVCIKY